MPVIRQDVHPSDDEVYQHELEAKVAPVRGKPWTELSPEEKEVLTEYLAFKQGLVVAPVRPK